MKALNVDERTRRREVRQKKRNRPTRTNRRLLRQAMVTEGLFSAGHPTGIVAITTTFTRIIIMRIIMII